MAAKHPIRAAAYRKAAPPRPRAGSIAGTYRKKPGNASRGERRRLLQLAASAVLLMLVVLCKLILPETTERYRQKALSLLGEDTDFVEVFSAVGQAVSPGGTVGDALNDAYTAVFGAQPLAIDEPAPSLPDNVELCQRILGFAYAPPLSAPVSDRFGYRVHPIDGVTAFHYGVDLEAPEGTPVRAFAAGTVTVSAQSSELGNYVIVQHDNGYTTLYAHCSAVTASARQQVALGDVIAEVGQTGRATGPHLHFELHDGDDRYCNPIYYVGAAG